LINGSAKEFIEGLHYGDERSFLWNGRKYFIHGFFENEKPMLELYILESSDSDFECRVFLCEQDLGCSPYEFYCFCDNRSINSLLAKIMQFF
jgi:hypothetical protein